MKGFLVLSFFSAVVLSVIASRVQLQRPTGNQDGSYSEIQEVSEDLHHHGNRIKRSPLDPIVAPLLIGKSFLYGALIGPKLFHRPRHYGGGGYGHGGYGHGGYGHGGYSHGGYSHGGYSHGGYGHGWGGWGWGK